MMPTLVISRTYWVFYTVLCTQPTSSWDQA